MDKLALPLVGASTVLSAAGAARAGRAAQRQGQAVAMAKDAEARQLTQRAGQQRAVGQLAAGMERKRERLVQSAVTARAAASGGGAADPTVVKIAEDIAAEGDFRARFAMFQADEAGAGLDYGAALKKFEGGEAIRAGDIARRAYNQQALTTILGGASQMGLYQKYGGGGPPTASSPSFFAPGGFASQFSNDPWKNVQAAYNLSNVI